jgi:tight adherence protein B
VLLPGILLPVIILLGVLAGSVLVFSSDARQRRMSSRIENAVVPGAAPKAVDEPVARIAPPVQNRLGSLLQRVVGYKADLPLSHIIPVWLVAVGAAAVIVVADWLGSNWLPFPLNIVEGTVVGFLFARTVFRWQHLRYTDKLLNQLPDAIELVIAATRAGLPVAEAFRAIAREMPAPTADEFARVVADMSLGTAPSNAVLGLYHRSGLPEYAIFAVTLAVQNRSGGRLAETIQSLAETVRARVALAGRAKALAAEATLSAHILTALPFISGLALSIMSPGFLDPLFQDPAGRRLLYMGIVLMALGMVTMRRLVNSATRQ